MGQIPVGNENSTPIELYYEDHGAGQPRRPHPRVPAQRSQLGAAVSGRGIPILSGEGLAEELGTAGFRVGRIRREGLPDLLLASRDS